MRKRIYIGALAASAALTLGVGEAQAAQPLTRAEAVRAAGSYGARDIRQGEARSFRIRRCHRVRPWRVDCRLSESGASFDGYRVALAETIAVRRRGAWVVADSLMFHNTAGPIRIRV